MKHLRFVDKKDLLWEEYKGAVRLFGEKEKNA